MGCMAISRIYFDENVGYQAPQKQKMGGQYPFPLKRWPIKHTHVVKVYNHHEINNNYPRLITVLNGL